MEKQGIGGTLVFYGCPAEEVLTGKGFMAREGAFSELDCALAWHPGRYTRASYSVCTGVHSVKYHLREGRPMLLVTLRKAAVPWMQWN